MVYALQQMGFDCGVDAHELNRINEFFIPVKDKFSANGTFDPYVLSTKTDALIYQIPGGMLSNLVAQLKAQNAIDRLDEVLAETPRVRADMGYPPLVTPLSPRRPLQVDRQGDQELHPRRIRQGTGRSQSRTRQAGAR